MSPQLKVVFEHLQTVGSLSTAEAWTVYKIRSLPTRITELKKLGHNITVELKKDATGQRYARYTLEAPEETIVVGSVVTVVNPKLTFGGYTEDSTGTVVKVVEETEFDRAGYDVEFLENKKISFVFPEEVKLVKTYEPVAAPVLAFNTEKKGTLTARIHSFLNSFGGTKRAA